MYVYADADWEAEVGHCQTVDAVRQTTHHHQQRHRPVARLHNALATHASCSLNIIIIISKTMFMVLSSWQSHCESSPGSFDECKTAPGGRRPSDQAKRLGLRVRLYRLPESTPTIAICYYYSARKLILIKNTAPRRVEG